MSKLGEMLNFKRKLRMLRGEGEEEAGAELVQVADEGEQETESAIFDRLALTLPRLVAPDSASHRETYYKVGDQYTRTLFIHNYPPQVVDNWLADILRSNHAVDVAIYIQPLDRKKFLDRMRQRLYRDEAAIMQQQEQGELVDARRVRRYEDYKQFIEAVQNDVTRPFQIMVAMTLRADSVKELDKITEEFERRLTAVQTRRATWRHKQGFESTLPLMQNNLYDLQAIRPIHTQGLMTMFPFSSNELTHERGVLVGVTLSGSPIILNRFMQPQIKSPNTAIFGATGSGKSFFAKLEMLRWNYLGVPVMVLDPSGEYRRVCEGVGGANIEISLDSAQVINPLDFSNAVRPGHDALREKIAFMVDFIGVMLRSQDGSGVIYDAVTKQIVDNALQETYRQYGYHVSDQQSQLHATPENMPRLSEVHAMLQRLAKVSGPDPMVQERIRPLIAALGTFVNDGSLAPLFDQLTTIDLRSHFINFDYSGLPKQYLPLAMHLVLEYLHTTFFNRHQLQSGTNRLLYIDEAQVLMKELETARFLEQTARTCRKYGIGLTVMTQDVGVFVLNEDGSENKIGRGILANCTIKALLKQEPSEIEAVRRAFDLTQSELSRLLAAGTGEGLIFVGRETVWFTAWGLASPQEYEMLTTTPDEMRQIAAAQQMQALNRAPEQIVDESHRLSGEFPAPPPPPASPYADPFAGPEAAGQPPQLPKRSGPQAQGSAPGAGAAPPGEAPPGAGPAAGPMPSAPGAAAPQIPAQQPQQQAPPGYGGAPETAPQPQPEPSPALPDFGDDPFGG